MLFLQATHVITGTGLSYKNGIVVIESDGTIIDVIEDEKFTGEISNIKKYEGIICPGFVNTHCHLELSYLKGLIDEQTGLDGFIQQLTSVRTKYGADFIANAIEQADKEMYENGIVAVGDISNTNNSFAQKQKSKLYYHTFIELYGFHPDRADVVFAKGVELYDFYKKNISDFVSVAPHAPYSLSAKLADKINDFEGTILTIHNQETAEEDLFFKEKRGKILDRLQAFGIDTDFWSAPGISSLKHTLPLFTNSKKMQLVHNTFTAEEDIAWAQKKYSNEKLFWCLCPNANLYIENKLPPIEKLISHNARITIGTDSLASNHQLSILEELKTIQNCFPAIPTETLVQQATANGALYLGIEKQYGSLEKGKKPGVVFINNVNPRGQLTTTSKARKLV